MTWDFNDPEKLWSQFCGLFGFDGEKFKSRLNEENIVETLFVPFGFHTFEETISREEAINTFKKHCEMRLKYCYYETHEQNREPLIAGFGAKGSGKTRLLAYIGYLLQNNLLDIKYGKHKIDDSPFLINISYNNDSSVDKDVDLKYASSSVAWRLLYPFYFAYFDLTEDWERSCANVNQYLTTIGRNSTNLINLQIDKAIELFYQFPVIRDSPQLSKKQLFVFLDEIYKLQQEPNETPENFFSKKRLYKY